MIFKEKQIIQKDVDEHGHAVTWTSDERRTNDKYKEKMAEWEGNCRRGMGLLNQSVSVAVWNQVKAKFAGNGWSRLLRPTELDVRAVLCYLQSLYGEFTVLRGMDSEENLKDIPVFDTLDNAEAGLSRLSQLQAERMAWNNDTEEFQFSDRTLVSWFLIRLNTPFFQSLLYELTRNQVKSLPYIMEAVDIMIASFRDDRVFEAAQMAREGKTNVTPIASVATAGGGSRNPKRLPNPQAATVVNGSKRQKILNCWNCDQPGHQIEACPSKRNQDKINVNRKRYFDSKRPVKASGKPVAAMAQAKEADDESV